MASGGDKLTKSRMNSLHSKGTSSWLKAVPNSKLKKPSDKQFEYSCKFRGGFQMHQNLSPKCVCGSSVDRFGHHFFSCKKLGSRHVRHKLVLESVSHRCAQSGLAITMENLIPQGRTDIAFHNLDSLLSHGDVSITHPCAKTYLDGAAAAAGSASLARERVKIEKYVPRLPPNTPFYPLIMESYGRFGKQFQVFLQRISSEFQSRRGSAALVQFKLNFLQDLSCALQKGNAAILDEGLRRML